GAVFELSPMAGGGWSETIIQSFNGLNGNQPTGGLATDNTGNIYGTSCFGGTAQNGVAFKLSPGSGGGWSEQVIHNFGTNPEDGICPSAGLSLDSSGNVYGTTFFGGSLNLGTVFELSLPSGLSWTGQILHSFVGGFDGANPFSEVTLDGAGNLYRTTLFGGSGNGGVVYEITPK